MGRYWTRNPQNGGMQSQLDSALVPKWGNTADKITRIRVPKGTEYFEGIAAPQPILTGKKDDETRFLIGQLPGGGNQIYIQGKVEKEWLID